MTFLMGEERERRWQHTVRTDSHRLEGTEGGAVVQVPRPPAGFTESGGMWRLRSSQTSEVLQMLVAWELP